jgi:hypothetical protein
MLMLNALQLFLTSQTSQSATLGLFSLMQGKAVKFRSVVPGTLTQANPKVPCKVLLTAAVSSTDYHPNLKPKE